MKDQDAKNAAEEKKREDEEAKINKAADEAKEKAADAALALEKATTMKKNKL